MRTDRLNQSCSALTKLMIAWIYYQDIQEGPNRDVQWQDKQVAQKEAASRMSMQHFPYIQIRKGQLRSVLLSPAIYEEKGYW